MTQAFVQGAYRSWLGVATCLAIVPWYIGQVRVVHATGFEDRLIPEDFAGLVVLGERRLEADTTSADRPTNCARRCSHELFIWLIDVEAKAHG